MYRLHEREFKIIILKKKKTKPIETLAIHLRAFSSVGFFQSLSTPVFKSALHYLVMNSIYFPHRKKKTQQEKETKQVRGGTNNM